MQSRHMLGNKQGLNSNSCRSGLIKTFLTIGFTIDLRGLHRIIYTTDLVHNTALDLCFWEYSIDRVTKTGKPIY